MTVNINILLIISSVLSVISIEIITIIITDTIIITIITIIIMRIILFTVTVLLHGTWIKTSEPVAKEKSKSGRVVGKT